MTKSFKNNNINFKMNQQNYKFSDFGVVNNKNKIKQLDCLKTEFKIMKIEKNNFFNQNNAMFNWKQENIRVKFLCFYLFKNMTNL